MAYLDKIVYDINSVLKKKLTAFPKLQVNGICSRVGRKVGNKVEFLPAMVSSEGDARFLTFDDVTQIQLYHKIVNSSYAIRKDSGYGDDISILQNNYDVELIVMADYCKISVGSDSLEAAIVSNLIESVRLSGVQSVSIYPVSANHNSKSIFSQEFEGVSNFLKPQHILFSIRYKVEIYYQKGCLSLCQCN